MNPKMGFWVAATATAIFFYSLPGAADETTATPAQINKLVEEINAYEALCGGVTSSDEALYRQCEEKQAPLLKRQKRLGLSNKAVNGKLQTRGWRWP